MLGSRGLDPELILRRGVADFIKLVLAVSLEKNPGGRLDGWGYLSQWRAVFEDNESPGILSAEGYLLAIFRGPVAERINGWIESSSIEEIISWNPPNLDVEPVSNGVHEDEKETWGWLLDRFTKTYLDRWSLSSLKREYGFIQGSWRPDFSTEVLAERVLQRGEVASALADMAIADDDDIDPATMLAFIDQAEVFLRDGQRAAAAAVFSAARMLKPQDLQARNNYAFCILIDKPEEAKGLLEDVIERGGGANSIAVLWCNLALAEWLTGQVGAALAACERAYESDRATYEAILWMRTREGWVPGTMMPRVWAIHLGAELERSTGESNGPWMKRLEGLNPLLEAAFSDPSSGEIDEEDL
jgi:tetratricopeptide (TPR) repeat protein